MPGILKPQPWIGQLIYLTMTFAVGYCVVMMVHMLRDGKSISIPLAVVTIVLAGWFVYFTGLIFRGRRLYRLNAKAVDLSAQQRYEEALAAYNHALKLAPKNPFAWNNKAHILAENLKRYDDALKTCDQATERGVSFAGIWSIRGNALRALGRNEEAQAAYNKALSFDSARSFMDWAVKSEALEGLGHYIEAIGACEEALMLKPNATNMWVRKARLLRALGREAQAQQTEQYARQLGQSSQ